MLGGDPRLTAAFLIATSLLCLGCCCCFLLAAYRRRERKRRYEERISAAKSSESLGVDDPRSLSKKRSMGKAGSIRDFIQHKSSSFYANLDEDEQGIVMSSRPSQDHVVGLPLSGSISSKPAPPSKSLTDMELEVDEELEITRRTMTTFETNAYGGAAPDGSTTLQCRRQVMGTTDFDAGRPAPTPQARPEPELATVDEGEGEVRLSAIQRVEREMRV